MTKTFTAEGPAGKFEGRIEVIKTTKEISLTHSTSEYALFDIHVYIGDRLAYPSSTSLHPWNVMKTVKATEVALNYALLDLAEVSKIEEVERNLLNEGYVYQ